MDVSTITASGYRDRNSTADRALTILEMFSDTQPSVTAVEVAAELSVARSTAYRYLESLTSRGFLEESPGGGFRLGLMVLKLARVTGLRPGARESSCTAAACWRSCRSSVSSGSWMPARAPASSSIWRCCAFSAVPSGCYPVPRSDRPRPEPHRSCPVIIGGSRSCLRGAFPTRRRAFRTDNPRRGATASEG